MRTASRNQPPNARDVERRVHAEPEGLDDLEIGGGQRRAVAHDHLALRDLDADRLDLLGRAVAGLIGQGLIERRVRHEQRPDQLPGQHPLRLVQVATHAAADGRPGIGDLRVAELGAQCPIEDPCGLGADGRPAGSVDRLQRGLGCLGQTGDRGLEECCPLFRGEIRREGGIDTSHSLGERRGLLVGDGDGILGGEVELERDRRTRRRPGLLGQGLAFERERTRGGQVLADDLAQFVAHRIGWQQVDRQDRRDHDDQRRGGHRQADGVVAGEPRQDGGALGQHQWSLTS